MKKVTIRELIEASRKNGYPWGNDAAKVGRFVKDAFKLGPDDVFSCVVGQGIYNLGGNMFPLEDKAFEAIYHYNDKEATSYADALAYMEKTLAPYLDEVVEI